ncbi:MAG: shikimate dehydrogenase [Candidatus Lokiarchaeota archaeon]|nr:shikimate dehydrogenase [Candidatus Lokiarchaeota archaeon]
MSENDFISVHTKVLCVIGYPIEHSMSPIMHNAAIRDLNLKYIYLAFNILPRNLNLAVDGIKTFDIKGINVTLPFKQKIMKYLDEVDPVAQEIGAVNTIKNEGGYLSSRNTDAEGAMKALLDAGYKVSGKNVLLLGAGGAARTLAFMMAKDSNKMVIANRTEKRAEQLANEIKRKFGINIEGKNNSIRVLKEEAKKTDILVNTTPLGMYPNIDKSPIPAEFLHKDLLVFDVVYNPLKTKLMKDANEKGCNTLGGLDMLVNQGALAFEWWTNRKPNIELMKNKIIEVLGML